MYVKDIIKSVADILDLTEIKDYLNELNNASTDEEFDEETIAIARDMKNLSSSKKKLLKELIKTMSQSADEELNK